MPTAKEAHGLACCLLNHVLKGTIFYYFENSIKYQNHQSQKAMTEEVVNSTTFSIVMIILLSLKDGRITLIINLHISTTKMNESRKL